MLYFLQRGKGNNLFGHAKFEVKNFSEFFYLQSALDSELFRGGDRAQIFFGNAAFEVKNFLEFFQ